MKRDAIAFGQDSFAYMRVVATAVQGQSVKALQLCHGVAPTEVVKIQGRTPWCIAS